MVFDHGRSIGMLNLTVWTRHWLQLTEFGFSMCYLKGLGQFERKINCAIGSAIVENHVITHIYFYLTSNYREIEVFKFLTWGRVFWGRVFWGRVFWGRVFYGDGFSGTSFRGRVFVGDEFSGDEFSGTNFRGRVFGDEFSCSLPDQAWRTESPPARQSSHQFAGFWSSATPF